MDVHGCMQRTGGKRVKLFVEIMLSVSLTGTVPVCICLLFNRFFDARVTAAFQYGLLKFCLACFFLPLALGKSLLWNLFMPKHPPVFNEYVFLDNRIVRTTDGFRLYPSGGFYQVLIPLWLLLLAVVLGCRLWGYLRFRKRVVCRLRPDAGHAEEFEALKARLGIRRRVSLLYCDTKVSPFTLGFFRPCVVITAAIPDDARSLAMQHELQHIRACDFLFRILAFAAMLLHCWNPFIYLFWKEFCEIQELACDERTTAAFSRGELCSYGHLLVDVSTQEERRFGFMTQFHSESRKLTGRRITRLGKRFSRKRGSIKALLLAACLAGSCATVFAVSPQVLDLELLTGDSLDSTQWVYMELMDNVFENIPEDEQWFEVTDEYLLFEDGSVIALEESGLTGGRLRLPCTHMWKNAMLKQHVADGKGGCFVYTYSVQVCKKCSEQRNKKYVSKMNYAVCPHYSRSGYREREPGDLFLLRG